MSEEERTLPAGETVGEGAGVEAPAAPGPETRGAEVEERRDTEAQQPEEVGAQEEQPAEEAAPEPEGPAELRARIAQVEQREQELAQRDFELQQQRLQAEIAAEQDPGRRQQLMVQLEVNAYEQTRQYMDTFARQQGLDPQDPRIDRQAPDRGTFEASVYRAALEDERTGRQTMEQKFETLKDDLPRLVQVEMAKAGAASGEGRLDPGDGGGAARVTDWSTATPEQVARKKAEIRARR